MIHDYLLSTGNESKLVFAPAILCDDIPWDPTEQDELVRALRGSVVAIQKLGGPRARSLIKALQEARAATVFVESDLYRPREQAALECDAVICPSRYLAAHFQRLGHPGVRYIPDSPDIGDQIVPRKKPHTRRTCLRLCWIGHPSNWPSLQVVKTILQKPAFSDCTLATISRHPDATLQWSLQTVERALANADVAVVPVADEERAAAKSANRVVRFMAAGVPVVASDIPAYAEIIENRRTGYLCRTPEEWAQALKELRDPELRQKIAQEGYRVASAYVLSAIGARYLDVFAMLSEGLAKRGVQWGPVECYDAGTWGFLQARSAAYQIRVFLNRGCRRAAIRVVCRSIAASYTLSGGGRSGVTGAFAMLSALATKRSGRLFGRDSQNWK